MFSPPLQGDAGHPGETGDPGPKGEKVFYFSLSNLVKEQVIWSRGLLCWFDSELCLQFLIRLWLLSAGGGGTARFVRSRRPLGRSRGKWRKGPKRREGPHWTNGEHGFTPQQFCDNCVFGIFITLMIQHTQNIHNVCVWGPHCCTSYSEHTLVYFYSITHCPAAVNTKAPNVF